MGSIVDISDTLLEAKSYRCKPLKKKRNYLQKDNDKILMEL